MHYIRDENDNIIQRSRNMRGIRRYVGGLMPPLVKVIDISEIGDNGGKLCILFDSGCSYETNFASFESLKCCVANWRNLYGAPLTVNGKPAGKVGYHNPALD